MIQFDSNRSQNVLSLSASSVSIHFLRIIWHWTFSGSFLSCCSNRQNHQTEWIFSCYRWPSGRVPSELQLLYQGIHQLNRTLSIVMNSVQHPRRIYREVRHWFYCFWKCWWRSSWDLWFYWHTLQVSFPFISSSIISCSVNMVFHASFFSPANTSTVRITTVTNSSAFYFTWEYQYVANFGQFRYPTGTAMKLDLLFQYSHLFTSNRGPITLHTSNLNNNRDQNIETIYVYDGADLNAPFLGNLLYLTSGLNSWKTSGKTMTLVNFYKTNVSSYGIVNDFDGDLTGDFHLLQCLFQQSPVMPCTTSTFCLPRLQDLFNSEPPLRSPSQQLFWALTPMSHT